MTKYDFRAYAVGLCTASACTSLTDEQATVRLNTQHPTGLASRWEVADDPTFATGQPNPCPCNEWPDTHRHILFHC